MATAKYEVLSQTIEVLLSPGSATFEVPVFQRAYAWGAEEIGQLLDDLFGSSSGFDLPYFLGSIVLVSNEGGERHGDMVLDGQQRLTTVSLVILALIEKMREQGEEGVDEHKMYLFTRRSKGKKLPKLKLQDADNEAYEKILDQPSECESTRWKSSRICAALKKIYAGIEEHATNNPAFSEVRITAPSEREAFRLFETLNDRGLDLSSADLVKNKLFAACGDEIDDAVEYWSSMLSYVKDDDVVNFLRAYWIATTNLVRKRDLYDEYRKYIDTRRSYVWNIIRNKA